MITVAIAGLLASVAVPEYYKYILKTKAAEAPIMLKAIFDAQAAFASKNSLYIHDETHGYVTCKPTPRFLGVCIQKGGSGVIGTKKRQLSYWYPGRNNPRYLPETRECKFNGEFDDIQYLGFEATENVGHRNHPMIAMHSYFVVRARREIFMAREYGVPLNNTLLIAALGDLDGDHDNHEEPVYCHSGFYISDIFLTYQTVSMYARGMYIDRDGEVRGTSLIRTRELE